MRSRVLLTISANSATPEYIVENAGRSVPLRKTSQTVWSPHHHSSITEHTTNVTLHLLAPSLAPLCPSPP